MIESDSRGLEAQLSSLGSGGQGCSLLSLARLVHACMLAGLYECCLGSRPSPLVDLAGQRVIVKNLEISMREEGSVGHIGLRYRAVKKTSNRNSRPAIAKLSRAVRPKRYARC